MYGLVSENRFFDSPVTSFDKEKGLIVISGRSIQLNSNQFWQSMKVRLIDYMKNTKSVTFIRFQLEYIHSSSVEQLLEFLKLSKKLVIKGGNLEVEWLFESGDEDMLELGNCINDIVDLPMKYIQLD